MATRRDQSEIDIHQVGNVFVPFKMFQMLIVI